jgi:hypothetical protein
MPAQLSRPFHIPRLPRKGVAGLLHRGQASPTARGGLVGRCRKALGALALEETTAARKLAWQRRALGEGVLATLVTTLLTSSVLAAPDVFRQSPGVTWRQVTTPALVAGDLPGRNVLLDCP